MTKTADFTKDLTRVQINTALALSKIKSTTFTKVHQGTDFFKHQVSTDFMNDIQRTNVVKNDECSPFNKHKRSTEIVNDEFITYGLINRVLN